LPQRPDLKLIVTSATLDAERFARHFGSHGEPAPVLEVSGRSYPVEVRYRPLGGAADEADDEEELEEAIVAAAEDLWREGPGDILVFLPGEREIRETSDLLAKSIARRPYARSAEILPLYARLSAEQQQRVFSRSGGRRIVLATNVAETSLTVPGIRYVIDSGLARVKRYSLRNKVTQLQIEKIAQAAAAQRAGRCGRVAAGVCVRLYDADDFAARPKYTEPEILRSSLAAVILRMAALDLSAVDAFPFLERPSPRAIADGYQLLEELGAVDAQRRLTPLGRYGIRNILASEGHTARATGDLAAADAATLLDALPDYGPGGFDTELNGWLAGRDEANAVAQLLEAVPGTDPDLAGRRVAAIAVLTNVKPDHARAILREVAANGPDGRSHVAAGVLANLGEELPLYRETTQQWLLIDLLTALRAGNLRQNLTQSTMEAIRSHADDLWRSDHPATAGTIEATAAAMRDTDKARAKQLRRSAHKARTRS